jgi:hypothetical protein
MIVRGHQQLEAAWTTVTRADLREELIDLWAQIFERELRADIEGEAPRQNPPSACGDAPDRVPPGRGPVGDQDVAGYVKVFDSLLTSTLNLSAASPSPATGAQAGAEPRHRVRRRVLLVRMTAV